MTTLERAKKIVTENPHLAIPGGPVFELASAVVEAAELIWDVNNWSFIEPIAGLDTTDYKQLMRAWLSKHCGEFKP